MAGADKTSPESELDVKGESRNRETRLTSINRQRQESRVTKKMDRQNRQDTPMVDRWFDRQLNQLYSDVISEPLPKEFVELIEKLREQTPKSK
jgi:hypothetical protein